VKFHIQKVLDCCIVWQLVNEYRQLAEDAWRNVHRLFMVDDDWKLERDVDDILVYSQHSASLSKILRLEVSQSLAFCPDLSSGIIIYTH